MIPTIIPSHARLIRFLFFFASGLVSSYSTAIGSIHSVTEWLASSNYARQIHKPELRPCARMLVILLLALPSMGYCADSLFADDQNRLQFTSGWFSMAAGAGVGAQNLSGVNTYIALSLVLNDYRMLTVRTSGVTEVDVFGSSSPLESCRDYGVLYGWRTSGRYLGYLSASAGISVVGTVRRGQLLSSSGCCFSTSYYETIRKYTVGIPFEAQAVLKPFDFIGLGLLCSGNINPERSFAGGAIGFYFGDLD